IMTRSTNGLEIPRNVVSIESSLSDRICPPASCEPAGGLWRLGFDGSGRAVFDEHIGDISSWKGCY
ncbi:MAG: hypothetical protein RID07_15075, partial [Lacipirellulaceae bacterium]